MEIGAANPVFHAHSPAPRGQPSTPRQTAEPATPSPAQLSQDEQKQLQALKSRDREVRAHEQAHAAAAGALARGGPSYTTQRGPDGRWYAVGGEVQIDTAPVPGDPHATLRKASQIQRAALAPAAPSAQDRAVAANAAAMAAQARLEIAQADQPETIADRGAEHTPGELAEPVAARCPVCDARHGAGAHNEALSQHFENTVTPPRASGTLVSMVA